MDQTALLEHLTAYLSDGQRHSLRIFGHGASGKSTFARDLQLGLGKERANLLETDPYVISGGYRNLLAPRDFPRQTVTACLPAVHELSSLERDIRALQSGLDMLTIHTAWSPSRRLSADKPILLVEGMSAAFLPKELFDLSICFYTDDETELERRLDRDVAHRHRDQEFVCQAHQTRRDQYRCYYKQTESEADFLINTSQNQFRIEKEK
ncbi:hypothetical protein STRDD11_02644 [Streptococcus sp. DD11]|uniref:uridine kinase family protein n=1 Tax=Streptococcus sp. DD11 TaxID=1777879 RepID=UPI00079689A4|nr:phosphoribulokinase [Streptococcus sp. DD11]KXT77394.1 hypothetical protein STRDD11_02644 [Streptococcus sp. DD11]